MKKVITLIIIVNIIMLLSQSVYSINLMPMMEDSLNFSSKITKLNLDFNKTDEISFAFEYIFSYRFDFFMKSMPTAEGYNDDVHSFSTHMVDTDKTGYGHALSLFVENLGPFNFLFQGLNQVFQEYLSKKHNQFSFYKAIIYYQYYDGLTIHDYKGPQRIKLKKSSSKGTFMFFLDYAYHSYKGNFVSIVDEQYAGGDTIVEYEDYEEYKYHTIIFNIGFFGKLVTLYRSYATLRTLYVNVGAGMDIRNCNTNNIDMTDINNTIVEENNIKNEVIPVGQLTLGGIYSIIMNQNFGVGAFAEGQWSVRKGIYGNILLNLGIYTHLFKYATLKFWYSYYKFADVNMGSGDYHTDQGGYDINDINFSIVINY
ncbi:hypothetical protein ACFL20_06750 [Spirochaetota bacterium]